MKERRLSGNARHVVTALVLVDLNIALRQLTLGPLPVLRAVVRSNATPY